MSNVNYLALLLLIEMPLILLFTKKDFLSMPFLASALFFLLSSAYSFYFDFFGRDILVETMAIIQCTILFLFIGEWLGKSFVIGKLSSRLKSHASESKDHCVPLVTSNALTYFLFLVFIGCGIISFYSLFAFSMRMGNQDISSTIAYTRGFLTSEDKLYRNPISYFQYLLMGIAYVYLFYYLYNAIMCGKRKSILLLPPLGYLFFLMTTTSRINMIETGIISTGLIFVMFLKKGTKTFNFKKLAKIGILFICSMFALMYAYGYFLRQRDFPFVYFFNAYFTAGLYGLDTYVRLPWEDNFFAQRSLHEIYVYLEKITGDTYDLGKRFMPFYRFKYGGSNTYTGLATVILDYGVHGMFLVYMVLAALYGWMGKKVRQVRQIEKHVLLTLMYCFFFYIAVFIVISDRLTLILSVPFIFRILSICIGNWLYLKFVKKERMKTEELSCDKTTGVHNFV